MGAGHAAVPMGTSHQYGPPVPSLGIGILFVSVFATILTALGWFPESYFKMYGDATFFMKYPIDTLGKFAIAAFMTFCNTLINAHVVAKVEAWLKEYLRDGKMCKKTGPTSFTGAYVYVACFTVYRDVQRLLYVLFAFTNVWFIAIQLLAKLIAEFSMTRHYYYYLSACNQ